MMSTPLEAQDEDMSSRPRVMDANEGSPLSEQEARRLAIEATATRSPVELHGLSKRPYEDYIVLLAVARNEHTPQAALASIAATVANADSSGAASGDPHVSKRIRRALLAATVAINPNASPAVIEEMVPYADAYSHIVVDRALRYEVDPGRLRALNASNITMVRCAVAGNDHTPNDVMKRLSVDPDVSIRRTVARTVTDAELLHAMRDDEVLAVRAAVAGNERTSPDTLRWLATDHSAGADSITDFINQNYYVLSSVASNPDAPLDVLGRLVDMVMAQSRSTMPSWRTVPIIVGLLSNPVMGSDSRAGEVMQTVLKACDLAGVSATANCEAIASKTNCTALLDSLAGDRRYSVKAAVAGNPATRPSTLARLAEYKSYRVSVPALGNPSTPVEIIEQAAGELMSRLSTVGAEIDDAVQALTAIHDNPTVEDSLRARIVGYVSGRYGAEKAPGETGSKARVEQFIRRLSEHPSSLQAINAIHAEHCPDYEYYVSYAGVMDPELAELALDSLERMTSVTVGDLKLLAALLSNEHVTDSMLETMLDAVDPQVAGLALRELRDRQSN